MESDFSKNIIYDHSSKEQKRQVLLAIMFLLLGLPIASFLSEFWRIFLSYPSAQLCSLFLGSNCIATPDGYLLSNEILPIHVTKACSADTFFILVFVLISVSVIESFRIKDLIKIVWIIPLTYAITLSANVSRIIAGWVTGSWARMALPENFWPGIHLGTGVVIFLTYLIVTYLILKWRILYGTPRH